MKFPLCVEFDIRVLLVLMADTCTCSFLYMGGEDVRLIDVRRAEV